MAIRTSDVSLTLLLVGLGLIIGAVVYVVVSAPAQVVTCFLPQEKDRLVQLAHEAVDEAYKDKVKDLYEVWVRDPADQPKRAMSGMAINLSAYHRARANVRAWEPAICP